MIIFAWGYVVLCVFLAIASFSEPEMIVICVLLSMVAFTLFQVVWSEKVDEYVYNCVNKEAKEIIVDKFGKTTRTSVDGTLFIVKNKNIKELKC